MLPHEMEALAAGIAHKVSPPDGRHARPVRADAGGRAGAHTRFEPPGGRGQARPQAEAALGRSTPDTAHALPRVPHLCPRGCQLRGERGAECWRIVTALEARLLADGRFHLARKQSLRSDTTWQGVVVDVGECACERPKKAARLCYSGKKRRHPLKAQVLLERHTRRILAVRVGKGRRHGFDLFKRSRARVHPAVERFADTGCQGLQKLHANTRKPAKATKNTRSPASRSAPTARSTPGAWSSSTASVA